MLLTMPYETAANLLTWSNRLYVGGAVLTLASAALVLYEKHSKNQGRMLRWNLLSEIAVIVAAFISLCGTVGAISFGNIVSHLKDVELAAYKTQAAVEIARANTTAEQAKAEAQKAREKAVTVENDNIKLGGKVQQNANQARTAEAALEQKNKETSDFAHALAQQQGVMAEQAKLSPILTDYQIQQLAERLRPYGGQDVILHSTADTTVLRLKVTIATALNKAGITFKSNGIDMGSIYQGVSVPVHDPQNIPPLADALVQGLRQAGIDVHPASVDAVPAGSVAIYLGPN
jgi:hypothetical protein